MACDGLGDVNVFLSPRVGFTGETPSPHPHQPTSLLTFADMVIALDSRSTSDVQNFNLSNLDSKLKTDHTYASVGENRVVTRSQSWRTKFCPSPSTCIDIVSTGSGKDYETDGSFSNSEGTDNAINSSLDLGLTEHVSISDDEQIIPVMRHRGKGRQRPRHNSIKDEHPCDRSTSYRQSVEESDFTVKRSSSFENVQSQIDLDLDLAECSSEWPQITKKNTPRKSCSFEEVNQEIVSQKRVGPKGGSSGQLHRLVNDTIEFPCWPRKADHTYATATWDGTAASHSLFEQEIRQEAEARVTQTPAHHQEMEVTETYTFPFRASNFGKYSHHVTPTLLVPSLLDSNKGSHANQKDDHTYVKPNSNLASSCTSSLHDGTTSTTNFSFATFPRQKTREDHTYFHSGMIRRGSGNVTTGGKEWASSHSVSDLPSKKDQQLPGTSCDGAGSLLQSVSTKKDHNYSTSS